MAAAKKFTRSTHHQVPLRAHCVMFTWQAGRLVSVTCSCGDVLDIDAMMEELGLMDADEAEVALSDAHNVAARKRELKVLADERNGRGARA